MFPSQVLSDQNKIDRLTFCQWILKQEPGFEQRIIFSDEKYFVLRQKPHSQNDRYWSATNPYQIAECQVQGDAKVMAFVALVDGRISCLHWFTENGQNVSVNSTRYLELMQDVLWPSVRGSATRKQLYFMQDGATAHTTNDVLSFLKSKFGERVISRRTNIPWPAKSPDLNILDFFFWSYAQSEVYRRKPSTIDELKDVVEEVCETIGPEMIKNAAANFRKRAEFCVAENGGHFEHKMK
jgi:hypothetical protein